MAIRMLLRLLPVLLLAISGCGLRAGPETFCGALVDLDASKEAKLERAELYIMGGYEHGSAVFDEACPSRRLSVDQYYSPASASEKDRADIANFWSTFLTKPRKAGGIFSVSVDATLGAKMGETLVRIEKIYEFKEVSEEEGARLYKVLEERQ